MTKDRWKLLAFCLLTTVFVELSWSTVFANLEHTTNGSYPEWVGRVSLWMPGGVGLRIANAFGYRFEVSRWNEMGPYVLITGAIGTIVWTAVLFGFVALVARNVSVGEPRAAA